MGKFKVVGLATACGLGLMAGWAISGKGAQPPVSPPKEGQVQGPQPSSRGQRADALLRQRLVLLRQPVEVRRQNFESATSDFESVVSAERDWISAKLQLAELPAERLAALRESFENARRMEEVVAASREMGRSTHAQSLVAKAERLKAEAALVLEDKSGKPGGE